MESRLNIIRRERQCSQCGEPGHNRRNCNFTTIDQYCRIRENTEFFQFPPIRQPQIINVITYREMRDIFFFEENAVDEVLEENEKEKINLAYFDVEDFTNKECGKECVKECGICLVDDIKACRMAKLNCGHEFCDRCTDKLITEEKSCCALCRAEITNVEVLSGESYGVLKDNSKINAF
jgi:hypothetical protein